MTALEALAESKKLLEAAGVAEPEAKAKVIISHALEIDYSDVYSDKNVPEKTYGKIQRMLERCAAGEPVEYITGRAYFRYLELDVNPSVLIPRNETELVAGHAIELIKQNAYRTALDMCTGSGCIAISLATETGIRVTAADISDAALKTAGSNAEINRAADIRFIRSDLFACIDEMYDIIVCNPPYVSEEEYAQLDRSVKLYEPKGALTAGDGYEFYRRIAAEALRALNSGGALVLEIGAGQANAVCGLLAQGGFCGIECMKDYAGRDRIVCALKGQGHV
jgi:release factor glutamine methyltransferase